jgi:hypothetical protein
MAVAKKNLLPFGFLSTLILLAACRAVRIDHAVIPVPRDGMTETDFAAETKPVLYRFGSARVEVPWDDLAMASIARTRDDSEVVILRTVTRERLELLAATCEPGTGRAMAWIRYIRIPGDRNVHVHRNTRDVTIPLDGIPLEPDSPRSRALVDWLSPKFEPLRSESTATR